MNKIQRLRLKKELTISELADEVGFSESVLRKFESGEYWPTMHSAKKIADYFGVTIIEVLGNETLFEGKFDKLVRCINHWADSRGLKQADPKIQWMRITEEVGEIRDVLLKPTKFAEPQAALKDAIGDTLVTIIVLAHQLDLDVTECLGIAYEEMKNRKGKMINGTFVKEEDL
ncbi:MAG: helix-turn-helix domain-containing protein [Streptococcus salivarius]